MLIEHNIQDRLYCITTDNASNNGTLCESLSALLDEKGIKWDDTKNHIACLTHIINLAVKEFLKTLKIQERTPEDEWEVLEYRARIASSKKKSKYTIKGTNPFDRAIQKVRKISGLINFPPSHHTSFVLVCEAVGIKPKRAVKDVETRWNSTYCMLVRAVYLKEAIDMWVKSRKDYQTLVLDIEEWKKLEFLVHFLAPFYITTLRLQASTVPTLQQTFETYEGLFNSIDNVRGIFQDMSIRPDWIQDIETGIDAMWGKLRDYYSDAKPYAYGDAILLHPSEKLRWFKKQEWKADKIEAYRASTSRRFDIQYSKTAALGEGRKRSFQMMNDDSDSDDAIQSEFDSYIQQQRVRGIENPLVWWKTVEGIYPHLSKMAKDTFAVPATGSGVEREFSISGAIVTRGRNRLDPTTISDIMHYKRWLSRRGVVANYLKELDRNEDMESESGDEAKSNTDSEEEELNQDLIDWLFTWQKAEELKSRGKRLEPTN